MKLSDLSFETDLSSETAFLTDLFFPKTKRLVYLLRPLYNVHVPTYVPTTILGMTTTSTTYGVTSFSSS